MPSSLIKPEIKKWFEKSITSELSAHNRYKYLAAQCQSMGLFGSQKFFLRESEDELTHYQKLVDFVNDMGDVLGMPSIPKVDDKVSNIEDALEVAYDAELALLKQYKQFYEEAEDKYDDCITSTFLLKFLKIQRKSVGQFNDLIMRYNLNKDDLFEFDEYLSNL